MFRFFIPLFLLCTTACNSSSSSATTEPRPVKYVIAKSVNEIRHDFAALSTADDASNLAFKIGGRIADIPVAKGQYVVRGELLAELDKRDVELQVEAAKAAYDDALSRLRRAERLFEHNAISQRIAPQQRDTASLLIRE